MQVNSQVAENAMSIFLDTKRPTSVPLVPMANKPKVPVTVKFQPDEREKKIIEAGQKKHGLKKAQDILSMALTHWARTEQIAS